MSSGDVKKVLDTASAKMGMDKVNVRHRSRLLSDNGPCYVSEKLRKHLEERGMEHTRGVPYYPMTQGKIERYHRSTKNVKKLQHYYLLGEFDVTSLLLPAPGMAHSLVGGIPLQTRHWEL